MAVKRTRGVVVGGAIALAMFAAGCTSSAHPVAASSSASVTATDSSTAVPVTSATALPTVSDTPTISATPTDVSSAPPPASATPTTAAGCLTTGLTVAAERGSGASGQQFATLTFTNISGAPCTLTGYPGVSLLLAGAALGSPAERSGAPALTLTLAAGGKVSSQLTDYSTCNAATSDTVRVYPPNQTQAATVALALRGCRLVVTPVAAA